MLKKAFRLGRQFAAWLAWVETQRRLQDVIDTIRGMANPADAPGIFALQEQLSAELARLRAAYIAAYCPPGVRMTFGVA